MGDSPYDHHQHQPHSVPPPHSVKAIEMASNDGAPLAAPDGDAPEAGLVATCPAFVDGCPYAKDAALLAWASKRATAAAAAPAPAADTNNNPAADDGAAAAAARAPQPPHDASSAGARALADCPAFADGCPFKVVEPEVVSLGTTTRRRHAHSAIRSRSKGHASRTHIYRDGLSEQQRGR